MATEVEIREAFGLDDASGALLFVEPDDALQSKRLRGQSHYIRRAFERLRLDGIVCINGIPTIYLKEFMRPVARQEVNELHRRFWNEGTGTLLLILDPTNLYVFSSMRLPSNGLGKIDDHDALVERLDRVGKTLEHYKIVKRVASGQYYRQHAPKFRAAETVDRHLLNNLATVGERLRHDETTDERKRVHAFLGRIVFTCYLIARGIIELSKYTFIRKQGISSLLELLLAYEPTQAKKLLYQLFAQLRDDFNGSMFDTALSDEEAAVTDDDIQTLIRFLRGDELESGQAFLGFWAYDFAVIPVETISAIYEKFLEEEDAAGKQREGAFYTPQTLGRNGG